MDEQVLEAGDLESEGTYSETGRSDTRIRTTPNKVAVISETKKKGKNSFELGN
jgi:hypothetical protein